MFAGFSNEVFLRLLWGEKRLAVWLKMTGSLILMMAVEGAAALGIAWLICGADRIDFTLNHTTAMVGVCFIAVAAEQTVFCTKNMVAFYQSREG